MNKTKNQAIRSLSNQSFYLLLISLLASFHESFYFPFIGGGSISAFDVIQTLGIFTILMIFAPIAILSPSTIFRYYPSKCCNNRLYKFISRSITNKSQTWLQTMIILTYLVSAIIPIRMFKLLAIVFNILLIYQYSILSHQQLQQQPQYQYSSQLGYSLFYFVAFKIIHSSVNSLYWNYYSSIPLVIITLILKFIDCRYNNNCEQQKTYENIPSQQSQDQQNGLQQSPSKVCVSLLLIGQLNNISLIVSSPFLAIRLASINPTFLMILQYSSISFALYTFVPILTRKVDQFKPIVGFIVSIIQLVLALVIIIVADGQVVLISVIVFNSLNQLQYQILQQYLAHSSSLKSVFSYFQYWLLLNQMLIFVDWFNMFEYPFLLVLSNLIMTIAHLLITRSDYLYIEQPVDRTAKNKRCFIDVVIFQLVGLVLIAIIIIRTYSFPSNNDTNYAKPLPSTSSTFRVACHNIQRGFQQQTFQPGLNLQDSVKLIDKMNIGIYMTQESECHYPITGNRDLLFYYQQEMNTRMNGCYGLKPNTNRFDASMLVSKYPIVYCQGIKFYNYPPFPQFAGTHSIVRIMLENEQYKDIHIVNIHPALVPRDINDKSVNQIVSLLSHLLSVNNKNPIILGGDFNIEYDDPLISRFTSLGFKHVYEKKEEMAYTRPATKGRIDHLLYINMVRTDRQVVSEYDQSDHLPIYGEFRLN